MTPEVLARVMEETWPPAARGRLGPFTLRDGAGGGKRVSAASVEGDFTAAEIEAVEAEGVRLFVVREGQAALDAALAARGYAVVDPVVAFAAPAALLAEPAPEPLAAFPHWPPLAIAREIWAEEGIGPARVAVMERARGPKTVVMARTKDHPVGVAFVAVSGGIAMLHALEVRTAARRQGSANNILRVAARWALDQGASTLSLVVTEANAPARALYASLGMQVVGQYHYRQKN
ncbi:GNAT family N-acetyltransferase [Neotabrizicola shimadae]|uniref:GNAT family N-acetyltransferase n=1 Tax=Neotabrizicola shimadae TaxID=2807096 RepID=A0A8G0ZV41_9RHOB|nr:GNAT family N-acetyltransferase [Neotabrizicola shimadae]QYZ69397.1 GNAT family N-acetyltransferase [Neotabrizicola shimadae]